MNDEFKLMYKETPIKFKLTRKQFNCLRDSLYNTSQLYCGDWYTVFSWLFNKPWGVEKPIDVLDKQQIYHLMQICCPDYPFKNGKPQIFDINDYHVSVKAKKIMKIHNQLILHERKIDEFNLYLSIEEVKLIMTCLYSIVSLMEGKWQFLATILNENLLSENTSMYKFPIFIGVDSDNVEKYKNKIWPQAKSMSKYWQINSKELPNDARILQDIANVLAYESGFPGIYSFKPQPLSEENLPIIQYPFIASKKYDGSNLNEIKGLLTKFSKKYFYEKKGILYVLTSQSTEHIPLLTNTTINILKNGYCLITK